MTNSSSANSTVSDDGRDKLITDHVPMAQRIARSMSRRRSWMSGGEDIESAAMLGLTEAAHRYQKNRQVPFPAFAASCVRGAVLDHLRRSDPLTRRARHQARRISKVTRHFECVEGRKPTDKEMANELGVGVETFRSNYSCLTNPAVLYLEDFTHQPTPHTSTAAVCEQRHWSLSLEQAMIRLSARERRVLTLYYREGMTLSEIGEELKVSESRVCQIRGQAVRRLRAHLS